MVSKRCIILVKAELDKLGLHYTKIELGEVEVMENLTFEQHNQLKYGLLQAGLELMDDQKSILIERIKNTILELIHQTSDIPKINFSEYISDKLKHDYTYLANLFSDLTGVTIEHFIIANKIERVKELLLYDDINLTEISYKLNYSSVAHLSNQFKKVTGLTPTFFRNLKNKRVKSPGNV
jgi:AraC-like DNA-binding protein